MGFGGRSVFCFYCFLLLELLWVGSEQDAMDSALGKCLSLVRAPLFVFVLISKNWNDYTHQVFVQNHLLDLLELLLDPDQLTASSHSTHSSLVSPEAVRALSFLIEGTVNKTRTVHPLHELALWQPLHAKNGYSKISKAFSFPKLEAWLRACLTGSPFGTSACLKSGKKLAWAQQGI